MMYLLQRFESDIFSFLKCVIESAFQGVQYPLFAQAGDVVLFAVDGS